MHIMVEANSIDDVGYAYDIVRDRGIPVMLDPGKLADGLPAASRGVVYAAGLGLNGPWIQHGGAGEGFRNLVAWLPGGRLSIHVLCNNGSVDPAMIAEQIVDALASYPSLRPAMPPIDGRYASADLPVIYSLQAAGDAKLNVGITPRTAGLGRDHRHFRRRLYHL